MNDLWHDAVKSTVHTHSRSLSHSPRALPPAALVGSPSAQAALVRRQSPAGVKAADDYRQTFTPAISRRSAQIAVRTRPAAPTAQDAGQRLHRIAVARAAIRSQAASRAQNTTATRPTRTTRTPSTPTTHGATNGARAAAAERGMAASQRMYEAARSTGRQQRPPAPPPATTAPVSLMDAHSARIVSRTSYSPPAHRPLSRPSPSPAGAPSPSATPRQRLNSVSSIIEDLRAAEGVRPPRVQARTASGGSRQPILWPEELSLTSVDRSERRILSRIDAMWQTHDAREAQRERLREEVIAAELAPCTFEPAVNHDTRSRSQSQSMSQSQSRHSDEQAAERAAAASSRLFADAAQRERRMARRREQKEKEFDEMLQQMGRFNSLDLDSLPDISGNHMAVYSHAATGAADTVRAVTTAPAIEDSGFARQALRAITACPLTGPDSWASVSSEYRRRRGLTQRVATIGVTPSAADLAATVAADRSAAATDHFARMLRGRRDRLLRERLAHAATAAQVKEITEAVDKELESLVGVYSEGVARDQQVRARAEVQAHAPVSEECEYI